MRNAQNYAVLRLDDLTIRELVVGSRSDVLVIGIQYVVKKGQRLGGKFGFNLIAGVSRIICRGCGRLAATLFDVHGCQSILAAYRTKTAPTDF